MVTDSKLRPHVIVDWFEHHDGAPASKSHRIRIAALLLNVPPPTCAATCLVWIDDDVDDAIAALAIAVRLQRGPVRQRS